MELPISYLIKSGLCLLALYLFYYGLLRKQPNFRFNRLYLLLTPPIAFIIPLLKWPASLSTETAVAEGLRAVQLPEIILTTTQNKAATTDWFIHSISFEHLLFSFYIIGAGFLFFKLCRQLLSIRRLALKATPAKEQQKEITILEIPEHAPTFAFLNYIFVSRQNHLTASEKKQVLDHEIAHVQLRHTWDILFYEVLTVLLWFNPVVWLLKNEVRDVHEYQADASALKKHQVTHYSSLLAKEVLYKAGIPVGSYFKEPQVIKRLQMLHKYDKHTSWMRPALLLPLVGALSFVFSAQNINATITSSVAPAGFKTIPESSPDLSSVDAATTKKDIVFTTPKASKPASPQPAEQVKPYSYVEQMPEFEGGDVALLNFLGSTMEYPEAARKAGKEGLVVVAYTVNTDGKLSDFELMKGVSKEIDEEAIRIIKMTDGKWSPGKQNGKAVPVKYTVPIQFKIY